MQTSRRDRLLDPQNQLQSKLKRLQQQPDAVQEERQRDGDCGHSGVEPEVVGGRDDDEKDQERVGECCDGVESSDEGIEARLATSLADESRDEAGVVEEGRADGEGVCEVERGHGGELIDVAGFGPDAFGVALADCVLEAVGLGKETGRHAGVEGEDEECGEVGEGHGAAGQGEGIVVGRDVVIPGEEAAMVVSLTEVDLI